MIPYKELKKLINSSPLLKLIYEERKRDVNRIFNRSLFQGGFIIKKKTK